MDITLDTTGSRYQVRAYEPGQLLINQETFTQSVIVSPTAIIHPWTPTKITDLTAEHLDAIYQLKPQILLLGTGERLLFPPAEITAAILSRQIGLEIMDTAAACRTFNVLAAEGRDVVAALIIY